MGRRQMSQQAGMPPVPYDGDKGFASLQPDKSNITFHHPGPHSVGKRTVANARPSGFNLRGVCEVLAEHGLDPVVEVARVLKETRPVTDRGTGAIVYDKNGDMMTTPALDIDMRSRILLELTNYVHPKLKAVEVTKKKAELTDEQIDRRLADILSRKQAKALD